MPAKSKSQQRLFGMVHAYNKGELKGSSALKRRIAALAKRIPDDSARHFAETPHKGLPEKRAQVYIDPTSLRAMYAGLRDTKNQRRESSHRRRSLLQSVVDGAGVGALSGGLGAGAIGSFLAYKSARGNPAITSDALIKRIAEAGLRCGLWGASRGAVSGAVLGTGVGIINKVRR